MLGAGLLGDISDPRFPCSYLKSLRGRVIREEKELARRPVLRNASYLTLCPTKYSRKAKATSLSQKQIPRPLPS